MTQHEKTNVYTKYTSLHYLNYLSFCVRHTGSANCIGFPIVCCTISKTAAKVSLIEYIYIAIAICL